MGSISIEIRRAQQERAVAVFEARKVELEKADNDVRHDPKARALQAEVKKANKRLMAIDAHAAHVVKVKADKAAVPKKEKGKKAEPAAGKKKAKKKKEKQ